MAENVLFEAQFHDSDGAGLTGLTPTVNVYRRALSDGTKTQVVTAGASSETGDGLYAYLLTSADLSTYAYTANFKTASTDAVQLDVAARALVVPDALVSSRLAPTDAGRTLDVAATGEASANVTYSAGQALSGRLAEADDIPSVGTIQDGLATVDGLRGAIHAITKAKGSYGAVPSTAESVVTSGSTVSGTSNNITLMDGSVWRIGNSNSIDFYFKFYVPAGSTPRAIVLRGASGDNLTPAVEIGATPGTWEAVSSMLSEMADGTVQVLSVPDGITADDGVLYVRFTSSFYAPTWVEIDYCVVTCETASGASIDGQDIADALLLAPDGEAADGSAMALLTALLEAGIDPQTIADAMARATVEEPEDGSVLAELAGVRAKTDLLTTGSVAVTSPVTSEGDVTVYQGDDYHSGDGCALAWSSDGWPDLTDATIRLYVKAPSGHLLTADGSVVDAGEATQTARVELTAEETATLVAWPGPSELRIRATLSNGRVRTLVDSTLAAIEELQ